MGVFIDRTKCIGCGGCVRICPGNLIDKTEDGKACLLRVSECWNCTSCMKECPVNAINMFQAPETGGRGASLLPKQKGSLTEWIITRTDGSSITIVTDTDKANKY